MIFFNVNVLNIFFFYSLVAMFLRFGSAVLEDNFVMDVTTRYHNYIFSNDLMFLTLFILFGIYATLNKYGMLI